ncbi:MAG: CBS domain-containing protein [Proteobacteria bacterium]|nr:CBS domain-containing protein [Pseudomonadota bacterium]
MPRNDNATPLIALDAVVIDTETTGLDTAKARVVEIGVVRIRDGHIEAGAPACWRVDPGEPIPPAATRIHGIDAAALAMAPAFAAVWPLVAGHIGESVVIGHMLGFDLAVLQRECDRAGIAWRMPRGLDTRLLAPLADQSLEGCTLDALAAWLKVELRGRHSAPGDADITARVFLALLPWLRRAGIRTLAQAERACRARTEALDAEHRAGWARSVAPAESIDDEHALRRLDSYPYRHRVAALMAHPPQFIAPDDTLGEALARMSRARISSLFVVAVAGAGTPRPQDTGIVTERDVLRAIAARGTDALALPVETVASRPLASVAADAFVYRAIGRMARLDIRHLGVTDADGGVCGALSARDLLRLRAQEAVELGDEIDAAGDTVALARAWSKVPRVAAALLAEGVAARDIAAVISRELAAATRAAVIMAERRLRDLGHGGPPCPYAFAVLGSAGRGESLLAMDQDNAIVFADGDPDGAADRWFARLGKEASDVLHAVGVPYCKGGVMAANAPWRGSVATWHARVADWIARSRPRDLLSVDIFFDLRYVHGDTRMANALWRGGFAAARGNAAFAKLLADASGEPASGLTLFGRLRTAAGRIDLKAAGLFAVVSAARVLAIRHFALERATPARLAAIAALDIGGAADLEALADAQATFLDLILGQQLDDIARGLPASNAVAVKRLSRKDRARLRAALHAVRALDTLVRDLLFTR